MLRNVLIWILPLVFFVRADDEAAIKEKGILATCPIGPYDIIFSSSTTDSVKLYLITSRASEYHKYDISKAAAVLDDPVFKKDYKTVLFVHGYNDKFGGMGVELTEAYQSKGNYNILDLDMSSLTTLEYFRASRAARYIGIRLGKLLSQFYKSGYNMGMLDLIGFSLGAHVAGYTAKTYFKTTGQILYRIIGLDPAGPCFKGKSVEDRLDKSDARFLQVIHTNAGFLGMKIPIGHVDFYLNGGSKQPSPSVILPCFTTCSHLRAMEVWKYVILYPNKFVGTECLNMEEVEKGRCYQKGRRTAVMGHLADPKVKGIYYVKTEGKGPYYIENGSTV